MNPKVTIIMATYNRAHFIVETLHSIQQQTFHDWECLIIDDGGADNTKEVITPILEKDNRFQFLKRPKTCLKGLPGCRNYGLDLAQGDFIIFFDDDDIVHPMNLELCVKELKNTDYLFCRYLRTVFTGEFNYNFHLTTTYDSFQIGIKDIFFLINHELPFNSCAVMWRKSCFNENRFVEHLMYAEEWELYSRILSSGVVGISINKILFFGRKHPNSNTGEFYSHNPIRKKSNNDAILLVIANLKDKHLLTNTILRYFIQKALDYKEYKLFSSILQIAKLSFLEKSKWQLFYIFLPVRLYLYGFKKKLFS
jgi:glycosyltransferase involved in cell wall biosynthesis